MCHSQFTVKFNLRATYDLPQAARKLNQSSRRLHNCTASFRIAALWLDQDDLISVVASCAQRSNTSCAECLQNVTVRVCAPFYDRWNVASCCKHGRELTPLPMQCLWCEPSKLCADYPVGKVFPPNSLCPLNDARWGVCWGETHQTSHASGWKHYYRLSFIAKCWFEVMTVKNVLLLLWVVVAVLCLSTLVTSLVYSCVF